MRHPVVYDEAILTSRIRYGDADCIIRLFCRQRGRISAFVKNGMLASKRRGGHLQVPSRARVGLVANAHSDLYRLSEIDMAAYVIGFGNSLRALGWAAYVAELVETFFAEGDAPGDFFDVVDAVFLAIASGNTRPEVLRSFELKLLAHVGHLPDLTQAVDYPLQRVAAYDPVSGHLLAMAESGSVVFDEEARVAAMTLLNEPIANVTSYGESTLRQIAKIFAFRLREQKKGPLKSVEFLRELGV